MTAYPGGGVAAGGRVAATPGVGGGVGGGIGSARTHGPAPASLGISPQNVTHIPPGDRGTAMARGFARPSTATKMGAHAPVKHKVMAQPKPKTKGNFRAAPRGGGGFHGGHR
jgi:hypothetical protein